VRCAEEMGILACPGMRTPECYYSYKDPPGEQGVFIGSHSRSGCHHIERADQISHSASKEDAENTK